MSDYSIRKLENDEFHLLLPLMKDCFGMNVNVGYFEWKFIKNPAGFVAGFIAIAADGEVAAYYGAIPELYLFEGVVTTIYQSGDTMTHSNHRRKGLFQKLALHCYEYLKNINKLFVIGFGGEKSTPGLVKFGWKHIFNVKNYFYPKALSFLRTETNSGNIVQINDYNEISDLLLKSNSSSDFHAHKTVEVFGWRLSNPLYNYKTIAYKSSAQNGSLISYLSYYIAVDKIVLFDFYFQNSESGKALVGYLKNLLSESPYKGIVSFCQENCSYSRALRKFRFVSNPFKKGPLSYKTPFLIYTNKEKMNYYSDKAKWLINSFDYDAM